VQPPRTKLDDDDALYTKTQLYARSDYGIRVNMNISSILQTVFSFRTGSTTVLASLFYLAIFVSLYITQSGPQVPSVDRQHTLGLSVDQAYRDLRLVSSCTICNSLSNSYLFLIGCGTTSSLQFAPKRLCTPFPATEITRYSKRTRLCPCR
jgi:hypothetical protein